MYKEFDDLMRRHNEYVVYEKPLAEMSNGKIVSGSKYIVIAPTAVLDQLEKEVAALEKNANEENSNNAYHNWPTQIAFCIVFCFIDQKR